MSQDLFAAFGEPIENDSTPPRVGRSGFEQYVSSKEYGSLGSRALEESEDDFGDFEDAPKPTPSPVPPQSRATKSPKSSPVKAVKPLPFTTKPAKAAGQHPFAGNMDVLWDADDSEYDAGADDLEDLANNPEAAMAYSKRVIAAQEKHQSRQQSNHSPARPAGKNDLKVRQAPDNVRKTLKEAPSRDTEILFDAEDPGEATDEDEEGFGDFEAGAQDVDAPPTNGRGAVASLQTAISGIDLLRLGTFPATSRYLNDGDRAAADSSAFTMTLPRPQPTVEVDTEGDANNSPQEDAWPAFEDGPAPSSRPRSTARETAAAQSTLSQIPASTKDASGPTIADTLPPTNVPPPAVLLSIFPSMFAAANEALFKPLAKLDLKQRQMLLGHPATHQFLRGYLSLGTVMGHIIAGRRLRWKRDQYLAQGMRIGAAGGKGGMKLAGLDKGEMAKEDREVLDVVRMWKAQVGKLRSAVVSASSTPTLPKLPSVPEINEQMPVRTLKAAEGGVTAPQACALCGLRREERVGKVDVEVEDSFGEWWETRMGMHLGCRDFWEENKGKLKTR